MMVPLPSLSSFSAIPVSVVAAVSGACYRHNCSKVVCGWLWRLYLPQGERRNEA